MAVTIRAAVETPEKGSLPPSHGVGCVTTATTRGAVETPKRGPLPSSPNGGLPQTGAGRDPHRPRGQPAISMNGSSNPPPVSRGLTPRADSRSYHLLGFYGDMLDDFEALRITTANRRRSLTDPSENGHGLSVLLPEIGVIDSSLERLDAIEHEIVLSLKRAMRVHPLGPWVKRTIGIGEKQMARLLGVIGNPAERTLGDGSVVPRTLKQLNAYCGMDVRGGQAPHHKRGEQGNWNDRARTSLFLVAESCIKHVHSPYRPVYDAGRVKYADALHEAECSQCGLCRNCGKPPGTMWSPCCATRTPERAPAGSPLRDGHKHARAMRLVMKAILRDLWREALAKPKDP